LFPLVEFQFGKPRLGLPAVLGEFLPGLAGAILMQPPDQIGRFGVMQAGYAVEYLRGIMDQLWLDPIDRQSQLA